MLKSHLIMITLSCEQYDLLNVIYKCCKMDGGKRTASMTWMTPFVTERSASCTLALLTITLPETNEDDM